MIPTACRDLLDLCKHQAATSESTVLAQRNIERATGMLNYALLCKHLTTQEHANEMAWLELIKATTPDLKEPA
jgi:hypothetical protein